MEKQLDIKKWITELEEKYKEYLEDPHVLYNLDNALLGKKDFEKSTPPSRNFGKTANTTKFTRNGSGRRAEESDIKTEP